jgi:hypothetical protein
MTPGVGVEVVVGEGVGVAAGVSDGVTKVDTVGDWGLLATGAHALATTSATRSLLTRLP